MKSHIDITALAQRGFSVESDFWPQESAEKAYAEAFSLWERGLFGEARVGKDQDRRHEPSLRGDSIAWLDEELESEGMRDFRERLIALRQLCNEGLYLGLQSFECHFARYPAGAFYRRHLDVFRHDDARVLSLICYLTPEWRPGDGGELLLHLPGGTITVEPRAGTAVVFLSREIEHEVLPTRLPRWSITAWFKNRSDTLV